MGGLVDGMGKGKERRDKGSVLIVRTPCLVTAAARASRSTGAAAGSVIGAVFRLSVAVNGLCLLFVWVRGGKKE